MKKMSDVVFILDRSGSMYGLEKDSVGGFNSMLHKQDGNVLISTVLFNDSNFVLHDRIPVSKVKDLCLSDFQVGGCTALLDAIGTSIDHMDKVKDGPVLFVIITDGLENSSCKYSYELIKRMIEFQKEKYGWEFLFLGANMDAAKEASRFGIGEDLAVNYCCDEVGTRINFETVGKVVKSFSKGCKVDKDWKKDIEEDYQRRK